MGNSNKTVALDMWHRSIKNDIRSHRTSISVAEIAIAEYKTKVEEMQVRINILRQACTHPQGTEVLLDTGGLVNDPLFETRCDVCGETTGRRFEEADPDPVPPKGGWPNLPMDCGHSKDHVRTFRIGGPLQGKKGVCMLCGGMIWQTK
jgi:hypothetical protein